MDEPDIHIWLDYVRAGGKHCNVYERRFQGLLEQVSGRRVVRRVVFARDLLLQLSVLDARQFSSLRNPRGTIDPVGTITLDPQGPPSLDLGSGLAGTGGRFSYRNSKCGFRPATNLNLIRAACYHLAFATGEPGL